PTLPSFWSSIHMSMGFLPTTRCTLAGFGAAAAILSSGFSPSRPATFSSGFTSGLPAPSAGAMSVVVSPSLGASAGGSSPRRVYQRAKRPARMPTPTRVNTMPVRRSAFSCPTSASVSYFLRLRAIYSGLLTSHVRRSIERMRGATVVRAPHLRAGDRMLVRAHLARRGADAREEAIGSAVRAGADPAAHLGRAALEHRKEELAEEIDDVPRVGALAAGEGEVDLTQLVVAPVPAVVDGEA